MVSVPNLREGERFMSIAEAHEKYGLGVTSPTLFSDLETELIANAVGRIAMPVTPQTFEEVIKLFDAAVEECPGHLEQTVAKTDQRFGNDIGYVRKEAKYNKQGQQYQDAKNLFHFNELAPGYWGPLLKNAPRPLQDFLQSGYDLHRELIRTAKDTLLQVEGTHPAISRAYFDTLPGGIDSFSFMRILSYDAYRLDESSEEVARPHFDIGGLTIQAYADAPGFWGNVYSGPETERIRHDTVPDEAYVFFGALHRKLYEDKSPIRPLWHGVDRIADLQTANDELVPRRHAIILFVDPPYIDCKITAEDTSPHLQN